MEEDMQIQAMRKHVLTEARIARNDVAEFIGNKGGITYKTLSYFDILFDNDTITESQYSVGLTYWGIKETTFSVFHSKIIEYQYISPPQDGMVEAIDTHEADAEDGLSTEIFLEVGKRMTPLYKRAIDACCCSLDNNYLPNRMAIFWAFNESTLMRAFEELERIYPIAKENALERIETDVNEIA